MSARSEGRRSRDEMQAAPPAPSTDLNPILATAEKRMEKQPGGHDNHHPAKYPKSRNSSFVP